VIQYCDAEWHYHEISLYAVPLLSAEATTAAPCECGAAALNINRREGVWQVALLDGTTVFGPVPSGNGGLLPEMELIVGVRRPLSES
jgi:hypothetical protein